MATHYPFLDRGRTSPACTPSARTSIAVLLRGRGAGGDVHRLGRAHTVDALDPVDDGELLIVGGEGHKVGARRDTRERYEALEAFAREHFDVLASRAAGPPRTTCPPTACRTSGALHAARRQRATWPPAFASGGLANGDRRRDDPRRPDRRAREPVGASCRPRRASSSRRRAEARRRRTRDVAARFVGDRLHPRTRARSGTSRPGEGEIVSLDGEKVAASRDDDGALHAVSARCTHLGCLVAWNRAERSWDCPCHGSRFAADGDVLQGPAVTPLTREAPPS